MGKDIHNYFNGHAAYLVDNIWKYTDNDETVDQENPRTCTHCNIAPVGGKYEDRHDACIHNLPGARHACCGHGVSKYADHAFTSRPYVAFEETAYKGITLEYDDAIEYFELWDMGPNIKKK